MKQPRQYVLDSGKFIDEGQQVLRLCANDYPMFGFRFNKIRFVVLRTRGENCYAEATFIANRATVAFSRTTVVIVRSPRGLMPERLTMACENLCKVMMDANM